MNQRFSVEWLGFVLGVVYWALTRNLEPLTLASVFYSIYTGWVWGAIPEVSKTDSLSWKHVFPPMVMVILMMVSANSNVGSNAEWVAFTAMALIHLRASVLSTTRLGGKGFRFTFLQLIGFMMPILFLFQKNLLPFEMKKVVFLMMMVMIGSISIITLKWMKRNLNAGRDDSRVLS